MNLFKQKMQRHLSSQFIAELCQVFCPSKQETTFTKANGSPGEIVVREKDLVHFTKGPLFLCLAFIFGGLILLPLRRALDTGYHWTRRF